MTRYVNCGPSWGRWGRGTGRPTTRQPKTTTAPRSSWGVKRCMGMRVRRVLVVLGRIPKKRGSSSSMWIHHSVSWRLLNSQILLILMWVLPIRLLFVTSCHFKEAFPHLVSIAYWAYLKGKGTRNFMYYNCWRGLSCSEMLDLQSGTCTEKKTQNYFIHISK